MLIRPRRLRKNQKIRDLVRETVLTKNDLIMPIFVDENLKNNEKTPITSMPGQFRYGVDSAVKECVEISKLGVPGVILFGIPTEKDEFANSAVNENGGVQKVISKVKAELGDDLLVIADVCMCEYTSHGHCGIIKGEEILNDETLEILGNIALSYAKAGVDIVAPSDMMDGRVLKIRNVLDENGFKNVSIMSYAAKYASAFYGPFRDAAESTPQFGDRKSYQMDMGNSREAIKEIELDIKEGADLILVKPALPYLDIVKMAKKISNVPVGGYCVSGEYSMIEAAAEKGWLDREKVIYETLLSIKRAGADFIITYWAKEVAKWL
ncbi:porphobilinogen synthase [Methanococcus maripaludis]|uniref:Delta-aminolevulinic acid dehydratase n=1 Tax=Methanococcus maripaludis (strain DSM 14266 / JCM 13030 / NBRC 101832 / S2 / LL) TaxID=267377 RepID=Q6LXT9_METMP|nr:porphobilinogen synthase [Methanococcus maripaludis]CAF30814.1 Delta-aminolevulinic acid dehydratase [Methanococcus maripaludis S2]